MDKDGKRRRQIIAKEKNISKDEFMAACIGDSEWLDQSLRDGHNPNCFDKHGQAPIHLAAMHGRLNCLELLVERYRVDVDTPAAYAWTPLHFVINKNSGKNAILCLKYLLKRGGDVNCKNDDNVTLLHQAASEGLFDCIQLLLQHGASTEVRDVRNQTPYDIARLWGHRDCARLLKTYGWKNSKKKNAIETKILEQLKGQYIELQKDAVHMLRNEQEFYGSVTYGNWLEQKRFLPDSERVPMQIDRNPDDRIKGLTARLLASGAMKDCAVRNEIQSSKTVTNKSPVKAKQAASRVIDLKAKEKKTLKVRIDTTPIETYGEREARKRRLLESKLRKNDWNYSTNVNTPYVTNIKNIQTITQSIQPDEDPFRILPPLDNLSVKLENKPHLPLVIKVTLPGGSVAKANIPVPDLPRETIYNAINGKRDDRIRIPQEFKSVHIFDVTHKKRPISSPSTEEVKMHLKMFLDHKPSSQTSMTVIN